MARPKGKPTLEYCPETGCFTRGGVRAGSDKGNGYRRVYYKGKVWAEHRLAFHMMEHPVPDLVDHINRNPSDNRWENLRPADRRLNTLNSGVRSDSNTGTNGIQYRAGKKLPWIARWYPEVGARKSKSFVCKNEAKQFLEITQ